ncbi:MAG TPA: ABC transporter permease [Chitinivibrionales bacterium]|nr:ABC transporter permease [Chitinivibrionales bacterium]
MPPKRPHSVMDVLNDIADSFGASGREAVEQFGSVGVFLMESMRAIPSLMRKSHLLVEQMMRIGVQSLSIVFLASVFIGAVSVWQAQYLIGDYFPKTYIGTALVKALFTDLGPVLIALVLTGRIGAKLAAELGTMKVTEQLDAMVCLSLNPFSYLLSPRILAGFFMTPFLMVFSFFFSVLAGQLLTTLALGVPAALFYNSMRYLFRTQDVIIGVVKGFVFGGSIALSGCYYGYFTVGGAVGVGESTKKAVVAASILILFFNVVINLIMM